MDENQRNEKGQRTMYKDPQEYDQFVDLYRMLQEAFITSSTTLNQHKTENPQTPPKPPKQETKVEKPITSKIKQTQIEEQMNQNLQKLQLFPNANQKEIRNILMVIQTILIECN